MAMTQRARGPISAGVGMAVVLSLALTMTMAMPGPIRGAQPIPKIAITTVPPYDPVGGPEKTDPIGGNVTGAADCPECHIVIFAHTDLWYVQPFVSSPYTKIEGGRWHTISHLGAEYTAVLVRPAYRPPATTDALPSLGKDVLAIVTVPGRK